MSFKSSFNNLANSMAWRLYAAIFLVSIAFFFSIVAWLAWEFMREESVLFDRDMKGIATTILLSMPTNMADPKHAAHFVSDNEVSAEPTVDPSRTFYLQVWSADGRLLMKSPLTPAGRIWPNTDAGLSWVDNENTRWRVLSLWSKNRDFVVQYAQPEAVRDAVVCEFFTVGSSRFAWFIVALIAVVGVVVRWSLRPLSAINTEIAARGTDDLSSINTTGIPSEVASIVNAFNGLLTRLSGARKNEQRFLSDAAHELRTPLAALRVQAQSALRGGQTVDREKALTKLVSGIDRTTRVAEQLLNIAHVDAQSTTAQVNVAFSLKQLAKDVAALLASECDRKRITVHIASSDYEVTGDPLTIGIAVRNILENAVRYTPAGGRVDVKVEFINGAPTLVVSDNGPGIPASERQKVLERFYRLHASVVEGSGLGLAIVKRVCDAIGATLMLDDAQLMLDDALFAEASRERTLSAGLKVTIQFAKT